MNHLIDYSVFCMGKVGVGFTPAKRCCEQLIQTKITLNQSAFFFSRWLRLWGVTKVKKHWYAVPSSFNLSFTATLCLYHTTTQYLLKHISSFFLSLSLSSNVRHIRKCSAQILLDFILLYSNCKDAYRHKYFPPQRQMMQLKQFPNMQ